MTKILLVEDDKSLREIYGVRLKAEGYDIVSAGDGEEALAMAIKERPGLIVSDVMMPKISGFDMLDILRSTTETKDVKVIMMTALSSDDQRARGEALGADRYLVKSQVGIEDVVRTVHEVLGDGIAPPAQTPAQMFNTPVPTPTPFAPASLVSQPAPTPVATPPVANPMADVRPAAPVAPRPVDQPTPMPQPVAPTAPVIEPPVPASVVEPLAPTEPVPAPMPVTPPTPEPTPQPFATPVPDPAQSNPLPQPTAPFSSNRPGSMGDRVIQPLQNPQQPTDISSMMNQELNTPEPALQATPPPVPTAPQVPNIPAQDEASPYIQQ